MTAPDRIDQGPMDERAPGLRGLVPRTSEEALALVGAVLLPLGLLVVLLGWYGAAHTPYLFEQLPYLISGGLLGLGLVTTGGLALLGTWVSRTARESRAHHAELLAVLRELRDDSRDAASVARLAATAPVPSGRARKTANGNGGATGNGNGSHGAFVATASGSMLHRPDCAVVAQRDDVHVVTAAERQQLSPCGLCDPFTLGAGDAAAVLS